jgi:biotin carboxyl carrier protein
MPGNRHQRTTRIGVILVVLLAGTGVFGTEPRGSDRTGPDPADQATLKSLDRRLMELERALDAALRPRSHPPARLPVPTGFEPVHKIRPRFPCWIEKVFVNAGQAVKQGDTLADLSSIELVAAKNGFLAKTNRWKYEQRASRLHRESMQRGEMASALWRDHERDEETSRLGAVFARDRLLTYGLSPREIDSVKDEKEGQKAHFALRSPIDGVVLEVLGLAGDPGGPGSVLLTIGAVAP